MEFDANSSAIVTAYKGKSERFFFSGSGKCCRLENSLGILHPSDCFSCRFFHSLLYFFIVARTYISRVINSLKLFRRFSGRKWSNIPVFHFHIILYTLILLIANKNWVWYNIFQSKHTFFDILLVHTSREYFHNWSVLFIKPSLRFLKGLRENKRNTFMSSFVLKLCINEYRHIYRRH